MMSPSRLLSTIAAGAALSIATLATLASPAAMAGNDIVRCVDSQGRVTLTDQPCEPGAAAVRLAAGSGSGDAAYGAYGASSGGDTGSGGGDAASERLPAQRIVIPASELRHSAWRPATAAAPRAVSHTAPLARDVATMKAAHRALLLLEAPRPSLAGLP